MVRRKNEELREWTRKVIEKMPHLTKPQAVVLAMWSFGIVMTQSCGLSTVAAFIAAIVGKKENTVRQQLREWYKDAKHKTKSGKTEDETKIGRAAIDVTMCFAPLMMWVLSLWTEGEKRLVLAADASNLSDRFTVLAVSIVYRGCGIPIAWKIVEATKPGSWQPHWQELFGHVKNTVPKDWFVIVATDRGLYADWLYDEICKCCWHPFMRINQIGLFRLPEDKTWRDLKTLVPRHGDTFARQVTCFKTNPITTTLLAHHDENYQEPWLILTDLTPESGDVCWYSMRSWIECLFKDTKRGGFGWHHTKMTDPKRAERHWLAIAVATLWQISVGGEFDANIPASSLEDLPPNHVAHRHHQQNPVVRTLSCFHRGFLMIQAAIFNRLPLPFGRFFPLPWPSFVSPPDVSQFTLSSA